MPRSTTTSTVVLYTLLTSTTSTMTHCLRTPRSGSSTLPHGVNPAQRTLKRCRQPVASLWPATGGSLPDRPCTYSMYIHTPHRALGTCWTGPRAVQY